MMNYIELIGRLLGFHRYCFFVLALHFFNAKCVFSNAVRATHFYTFVHAVTIL